MDKLSKLTPGAMLTLGGLVLYFIDSFLPWQELGPFSFSEWRGIGILAALLGIALLLWEALPLVMARPALGTVSPRLVSLGLAAALVLFTLITTLDHSQFRKIWSWIGLILSIAVAVGVWMQAKEEGFQMPSLSGMGASGSSGGTGTSAPAAPPSGGEPTPPPSEPAAPSGEAPPGEAQP